MDKNNFKKNGMIRVLFETPEERARIIQILEKQRCFNISEKLKQMESISPYDTRSFDIDLKLKKYTYSIQPFIGAAMCSNGVRFYSADEFFQIAEMNFKVVPRFLVFHVPHDGQKYPAELMKSVCVPEERFTWYHEKMRDKAIRQMIPTAYRVGSMNCHFEVSRLLCDVERFIGPDEIMESYGMGFCYERAYDGTIVKQVTDSLREQTMVYYQAHHRRLDSMCYQNARVLLFDLHSFSDEIVPRDFFEIGRATPDICIGTSQQYTPQKLVEIVQDRFSEGGFTTAINYPYSGTLVPNAIYDGKSDCDCISVMIEVNKRIYLDDEGQVIQSQMERLKTVLHQVVVDCVIL